MIDGTTQCNVVAPLAGAWIETFGKASKRGCSPVAPLAGAWIETLYVGSPRQYRAVAPLAGAWIETAFRGGLWERITLSRPSRARGLKPRSLTERKREKYVAPLAGAWIETSKKSNEINVSFCRAPRGRVD